MRTGRGGTRYVRQYCQSYSDCSFRGILGEPPVPQTRNRARTRAQGATYDRTINLPPAAPSPVAENLAIPVPAPIPAQSPEEVPPPPPSEPTSDNDEDRFFGARPGTPPAFLRLDAHTVALPVYAIPRAGPHSPSRRTRPQPAKSQKAADVWSFFGDSNVSSGQLKKGTKPPGEPESCFCAFCL